MTLAAFCLTGCGQTDTQDLPESKPPDTAETRPADFNTADCMVIRQVKLPITKRGDVKQTLEIALLKTCLSEDEAKMSLPMITVFRNGKPENRAFMVERTFKSKKEAIKFAADSGITDVEIK